MSDRPNEPRSSAQPEPRARNERRRTLVVDGEHWVVREIDAPSFDRRGGPHLIFESSNVFRRVRAFPADWHELEDEALYELSLNTRID